MLQAYVPNVLSALNVCCIRVFRTCCNCRPLALVSMRADRAKPRPPTRGGGAGRRQRCGDEAQAARCCCRRGGGESSEWPRRDGCRPVWKRTGASHRSSVGSESETNGSDANVKNGAGMGGQSSCGRPDASAAVCISHKCKRTASPHAE